MSTLDFYLNLTPMPEFNSVTDEKSFVDLPEDWTVIITDIKGSTAAIEMGRYRDVNTIGAATIAAAQNAIKKEFPFVFGGDGATLVVPNDLLPQVKNALLGVQSLSIEKFQLNLRIGLVKVRELYQEGYKLKVARHQLSAGKCIAMFIGGALQAAEDKIKLEPEKYNVSANEEIEPDLDGLSCRWNPIPNKNGLVLSILVLARGSQAQTTYLRVIQKLESLLEANLDCFNPVNIEKASYKSIFENIQSEQKLAPHPWHYTVIFRAIEIMLCALLFQLGLGRFFGAIDKYEQSMEQHSDYRKFDEMLRLVIDCSEKQKNKIREYFESEQSAGSIYFGTHTSKNSLMTCYVNSIKPGDHIHFIDGDDGGYAMAAKEMKAQMKQIKAA